MVPGTFLQLHEACRSGATSCVTAVSPEQQLPARGCPDPGASLSPAGLSWDRGDGPQCVPTARHASSAVTKGLGRNLHSKHLFPAHPLHPELPAQPPRSLEGLASSRTDPVVTNPPGSCTESGLPLRGKVAKKKKEKKKYPNPQSNKKAKWLFVL